jgi:hypothetical protein
MRERRRRPQQNKNWLIVIGREAGKAKVKDYYNDPTRMANSPVGRDWFAKNGFASRRLNNAWFCQKRKADAAGVFFALNVTAMVCQSRSRQT